MKLKYINIVLLCLLLQTVQLFYSYINYERCTRAVQHTFELTRDMRARPTLSIMHPF